jgi:hypothetical protein
MFSFLAILAYNQETIWARSNESRREVSTIKLINFLIVSFTLVVVVVIVERIWYESLRSVSDSEINRIRIEMKNSKREILEFSRFSFIRFEFDSLSRYNNRDESESSVALSVNSDHDIAKIIVHEVKKNIMLLTICENLE